MYYIILITYLSFLTSICFSQNVIIPTSSYHSGGKYSIYRSATDSSIVANDIRKPIIWIEGFELIDEVSIQQNYNTINQTSPELNISLANQLHAAGYDIVILNFNNPNDYIQRNVKVLQELIQTINNDKLNELIKNSEFT